MREPLPPHLPEPPDDSVVGTPPRRPGSVRRTATINMVWPGGYGTPTQLRGRARDLLTPLEGEPVVLAEGAMTVDLGPDRTIAAISVSPERPTAGHLVGARGGGGLRGAIDEAFPGEREAGTPLYFLLDDLAGASLIAGFAWSLWRPLEWGGQGGRPPAQARMLARGQIICSGLRPGGYMEERRGAGNPLPHFLRLAGDLSAPDDPWAWHDIEPAPDVCMRRRRRVDVWRDGSLLEVDAHFRDSMWAPGAVENSVHEYSLHARIDPATHTLVGIEATPRVLPFPECPWAAPHVTGLVDLKVERFRTSVQDTLRELQCCTHLNDMLRGLAEVPVLGAALPAPADVPT